MRHGAGGARGENRGWDLVDDCFHRNLHDLLDGHVHRDLFLNNLTEAASVIRPPGGARIPIHR